MSVGQQDTHDVDHFEGNGLLSIHNDHIAHPSDVAPRTLWCLAIVASESPPFEVITPVNALLMNEFLQGTRS